MASKHEEAVLAFGEKIEAAGGTVISANVQEGAPLQIFAQNGDGELAFYLLRAGGAPDPTEAELTAFRELAAKHQVVPYWVRMGAGLAEAKVVRL
ncbi:MAG: hypothetical protein J6334_01595 [Kiritimatiellae bacterium]|nr:hypothetical protein [Kiritimatiellia bacterium]